MSSWENRQIEILDFFASCASPEESYAKLIELGKRQQNFSEDEKQQACLVPGCQSKLYLFCRVHEGQVEFKAQADALISAGLAQLLIWFYSGCTLEEILKIPPLFLDTLKIPASLTPSRTNGLYSIHLKMKQEALKALANSA